MNDGDQAFSEELERWLRSDGRTIGSLAEVFGERGLPTTILLLMFVPATPLPTGGVTHVLEAIAIVVAVQMVLGCKALWLPERWSRRQLGQLVTAQVIPSMVRVVRSVERFSKPRGASLFRHRGTTRLCGVALVAFAAAAALAPPFSGLDTLPAMGAVAVCLSMIFSDVVLLLTGVVLGTGGTAVIITVGSALARLAGDVL